MRAVASRLVGSSASAASLHTQRPILALLRNPSLSLPNRNVASRLAPSSGSAAAAFSTRPAFRSKQPSTPAPKPAKPAKLEDETTPEIPTASFSSLGLSRGMKIVLLAILSVFGTMETWFYCKWIYRWWKGEGFAVERS